jgi:hypothetical protein
MGVAAVAMVAQVVVITNKVFFQVMARGGDPPEQVRKSDHKRV